MMSLTLTSGESGDPGQSGDSGQSDDFSKSGETGDSVDSGESGDSDESGDFCESMRFVFLKSPHSQKYSICRFFVLYDDMTIYDDHHMII